MSSLLSLRRAAVSVCLLTGLVAGSGHALAEPLEGAVRLSLNNAKLEHSRVGVAIVDCDSREALASINSNDLFAPASNLKLITSGVALTILKDFEFKTGFSVTPDGRLIIKGAGDPALCDPKLLEQQGWSVERFVARIVDAAKAAKVTGIKEVIVDDRVFERDPAGMPPVHATWPREQLNQWYCAPVSGLNFFTNVLALRASRGERVGQKPNFTSEPSAPWLLNLDLSATRTVNDGSNSIWAQQDRGNGGGSAAFTFKVFGDVKQALKEPVNVTVAQPGVFFASLLFHELWEAGLTTGWKGGNNSPPVRVAAEGEDLAAAEATPFAVITTPLATAMKRCNVDSQNLYAECLLKRTAYEVTQQPGSWATGAQIVTMRLTEKLGQEAQAVRIVDGSGLSKDNQITPMVMAHWLSSLQQDRTVGAAFLASMARADDKEARISKRFSDRKLASTVYAKTGYIKNVLCLSGYVVRGERTIAYSVLVNDVGGASGQRVKDFQEEVVMTIDHWLSRQAAAAGN
jgi:D-alanyl-D-alanine carboxypeptidase/D-alanyl-D-alanine-endopeptidase (penicillin-binding protein 4)